MILVSSCTKVITQPPVEKPSEVNEDTTNLKNYNKDITIVNWNIEWFGYPYDGQIGFKGNLKDQETNSAKILKYLNADLYGICEVVDTARFGRMIRNTLGDDFRYKISYYPTLMAAQKLAFVYNRNIFRHVTVRPFMGLSTNADFNFAKRYPLLLTAEVVVNGRRNVINYILTHAKAGADQASYARRLNASIEMKDSLDRYFNNKNFMIIGDYNDNLVGSITTGKATPYQNFLGDEDYAPISLPLNNGSYQSTISTQYAGSVIDQQMISATMSKWYVVSSIKIRTDVTAVVHDYLAGSTSDHYPVSSDYRF